MKRLLFIVCSLAVASSLFGAQGVDSKKPKQEQKTSTQMSDEEWDAKVKAHRKEKEEVAAINKQQEERDEQFKKDEYERWIQEGGWGVPFEYSLSVNKFVYDTGTQNSVSVASANTGIKIGVSKRQFHKNLEFRAMSGIGYVYFDEKSSYSIPLSFEVGWVKEYERSEPSFIAGIGYEYSPFYDKTELYVIAQPRWLGMGFKVGYGFAGGVKVEMPTDLKGGTKTVKLKSDGIWSFGLVWAF